MSAPWPGLWVSPGQRAPPRKNPLRVNDPIGPANHSLPPRPMSDAFSIMFWPLIACLLLPGILVYYGLHIVRREIIFVDLALAQVAALGTCVAILCHYEPGSVQSYRMSLGFTLVGAVIFTLTRNKSHHHVPQEALIGIVYVVAAALGILLLN